MMWEFLDKESRRTDICSSLHRQPIRSVPLLLTKDQPLNFPR
jgi:hypothetical protein